MVRMEENSLQSPTGGRERKYREVPEHSVLPDKACPEEKPITRASSAGFISTLPTCGKRKTSHSSSLQFPTEEKGAQDSSPLQAWCLPKGVLGNVERKRCPQLMGTGHQRMKETPCSLHLHTNFLTSRLPSY